MGGRNEVIRTTSHYELVEEERMESKMVRSKPARCRVTEQASAQGWEGRSDCLEIFTALAWAGASGEKGKFSILIVDVL